MERVHSFVGVLEDFEAAAGVGVLEVARLVGQEEARVGQAVGLVGNGEVGHGRVGVERHQVVARHQLQNVKHAVGRRVERKYLQSDHSLVSAMRPTHTHTHTRTGWPTTLT